MAQTATPVGGEGEVKLVMAPSNFWLRLRVNWRAQRRRLWWLVPTGFLLPTLILPVMFIGEGWPFAFGRTELVILAAGANIALIAGLTFVILVLRSIFPSDQEKLLPAAITFRPDSLRVEPRRSDAFEDSYAFVLGATRTATGLDLKICETPLLVLYITPLRIGEERFGMLELWLQRHGKLPAG